MHASGPLARRKGVYVYAGASSAATRLAPLQTRAALGRGRLALAQGLLAKLTQLVAVVALIVPDGDENVVHGADAAGRVLRLVVLLGDERDGVDVAQRLLVLPDVLVGGEGGGEGA
jgi:hypothetical protein